MRGINPMPHQASVIDSKKIGAYEIVESYELKIITLNSQLFLRCLLFAGNRFAFSFTRAAVCFGALSPNR